MSTQNIINQVGPTPQCFIYLSVSQLIPNSLETVVRLDTPVFDTTSAFDTSTFVFNPKIPGNYLVSISLTWDTSGITTSNLSAFIRINGFKFLANQTAFNAPVGNLFNQSVGGIINLNGTTDYVDVSVDQDSGIGINVNGSFTYGANFSASLMR